MKYYAVKQGKKIGIFESWAEAEKHVKGVSGAKFKSFTSYEDALNYIGNFIDSVSTESGIEAFVDGSFDKFTGRYASGIVIVKNANVLEKISFSGSNIDYVESHQIAGEVLAAIAAIEWAIEHDYTELTICYDYEGIESWAVGEWKTNKAISKSYKKKFDALSSNITVHFRKVKAHSGVKYNELADQLAKDALSQTEVLSSKDTENDTAFYDYMVSKQGIKTRESFVQYREFIFNEKKIVNYLKLLWKNEGNRIGDVKKWSYKLDIDKQILYGYLELKERNIVKEYNIKF